jgi:hypothetical protein
MTAESAKGPKGERSVLKEKRKNKMRNEPGKFLQTLDRPTKPDLFSEELNPTPDDYGVLSTLGDSQDSICKS